MSQEMFLRGRIAKHQPVKRTQNGTPVGGFTFAVNYYKGKHPNRTEHTNWYYATVWGSIADQVAALPVGAKILMIANYEQEKYTDKNGVEKTANKLTVKDIGPCFIEDSQQRQQQAPPQQQQWNNNPQQRQYDPGRIDDHQPMRPAFGPSDDFSDIPF